MALKKEEIKVKTLKKKNTEYVSVFTTFLSYKIANQYGKLLNTRNKSYLTMTIERLSNELKRKRTIALLKDYRTAMTRVHLKPNLFLPSDTDECTTKTDNFDVNAACTNTVGSHVCACKFVSSGDGITCYVNY